MADHMINFGSILFRQIIGFPMGTNCDNLVAKVFLSF